MKKPQTKHKGDIGLTQVLAHLEINGITSALPIAHYTSFDIIGIDSNSNLSKISIKYVSLNSKGVLQIPLNTVYATKAGNKISRVNFSEIDGYAVYCPDNQKVYYIDSKTLESVKGHFSLRVGEVSSNYTGSLSKIRWASDFESPKVLFNGGMTERECDDLLNHSRP